MYHFIDEPDEDKYDDRAAGWCDCGRYVIDTGDGYVDAFGDMECEE